MVVLAPEELRRVRGVLYLCGLRGEDLAEAIQDVQLRLLERAPEDIRSAVAWACAVAGRLAVDRHRRAGTRARLTERLRVLTPTTSRDPDVALEVSVRAAIATLPADLRAVVVLRYYADLEVDAMASALDVPSGTVKSRLHRAQQRLRACLGEQG